MTFQPTCISADTTRCLHDILLAMRQPPWLRAMSAFTRSVDTTAPALEIYPPPYYTAVNPCDSRMEGTLGGRLSAEFSTQKPRAIAAQLSVRTREPQRLWDSFPCRRALPVSLVVSRAREIAPTGTPPKGLFALHRPV